MRSNASRDHDWARVRGRANQADYLEPEQERTLLARASFDERALTQLVQSHMRLVVRVAQRHAQHGVSVDDLVSEGVLGLLEAIRRFDPGVDTRLSTYAKWWIYARVRAYALRNRRLVALPATRAARRALAKLPITERRLTRELGRTPAREEVASAIGVSLEDLEAVLLALPVRDLPVTDEDDGIGVELRGGGLDPERALVNAEQIKQVAAAVERTRQSLTWRQRRVLDAQLLDEEDLSFRDLSIELGVTRQRVSQIAVIVRERLRHNLEAHPRTAAS